VLTSGAASSCLGEFCFVPYPESAGGKIREEGISPYEDKEGISSNGEKRGFDLSEEEISLSEKEPFRGEEENSLDQLGIVRGQEGTSKMLFSSSNST
jgi:hypothetical protein